MINVLDLRSNDKYNELCACLAAKERWNLCPPIGDIMVFVSQHMFAYKRVLLECHAGVSVRLMVGEEFNAIKDWPEKVGLPIVVTQPDYVVADAISKLSYCHLIEAIAVQVFNVGSNFKVTAPSFFMDAEYPGLTGMHIDRFDEYKMPRTSGTVLVCNAELFDDSHISNLARYLSHNLIELRLATSLEIEDAMLYSVAGLREIALAGCILCTSGLAEIFATMFNIPTCVYQPHEWHKLYRVGYSKMPNIAYHKGVILEAIKGRELYDQAKLLLGVYTAFDRHRGGNERVYEDPHLSEI